MPSHSRPPVVGPHIWNIQWVRDLAMCGALYFLFKILVAFNGVLMPVWIALLLAYLTNPWIEWAERRWKWRRPATAGIIIFVSILLTSALVLGMWPVVEKQLGSLAAKLPTYIQTLATRWGIDLESFNFNLKSGPLSEQLKDPRQLFEDIFSHTEQALGYLQKLASFTGYFALNSALIPIYYFFFAWHFHVGRGWMAQFIPMSRKERIFDILGKMDLVVADFFRGRLLVSGIMIVLYSLAWLICDVPYWFLLGALAGILNIVPYASGVFWPLAILLKYFDTLTGNAGSVGFLDIVVWPSLGFLIPQFFESWVLTPWIQADKMEMSVPTVLIVAFIGGSIGGFFGLLLCIPVAACLKILYKELLEERLARWALRN